VHAAVQIDTYGEHDGSIRYEISERDWQGEAHRGVVIQRLKESDSGNPRVLRNFTRLGIRGLQRQQIPGGSLGPRLRRARL
jgi:hypothetical protein